MEQKKVHVCSQMGGWILECCVKPGDFVHSGDTLLVIESMKMRIPIMAPVEGKVEVVHVELEAVVNPEDVLVTLSPTCGGHHDT